MVTKTYVKYLSNTPNANMTDHSVGARDEYESEASEASVFCFDNVLLRGRSSLFYFAMPLSS